MRAFHNSKEIKAKYIARVKEHAAADEIVKGQYWKNGKGCAVGCSIHSSDHAAYETELGIPKVLAYLEDRIFENLPNELAMTWPLRFFEAIKVGADLELVWPKFAHWLLVDPDHGVIRFSTHECIANVAALLKRWIDGNKPDISEWRAAHAYAYTAAHAVDAAAHAAARAVDAAAHAVYAVDAAYTAAHAADAAAYAAVYAAAAAAAHAKHFVIMHEKLLELLAEAPTDEG